MSEIARVLMQQDGANPVLIGILVVVAIAALVFLLILLKFARLWLQAYFSRADIKLSELIGMWLRKVDARVIVLSKITAIQAGLELTTKDLESHYLAGGRVPNVVRALIAANRANIDLTFKTATAIDLAGRDILDAIQTSVNPKVIDCPDPKKGKETIDAVAQDGIQLRAKARVTVRTNIHRLVGGATEETVIARVGEGIVTSIGSSITYKSVLENPDRISKAVLGKGLDAGTAFEILSIDIADVDVGDNVGAQLQAAQAEADMRRAKAEAEKRRAMAVAREQEMRALVVENESKVPLAIAEAFQKGNLGIMDYYRLKNIGADTQMRESIAKPKKSE
ncbi:MAG TPA: flotillin-like protein FloA [Sedimentisphaerales bacterium]|nr:flotillin-like protein FloA [Sedimentisphaerales bacterium]HRS12024.1 flotillin-like protein FloA [Sedimentisphaerales bacterium]HRV48543.1 flotillin-like protein FloA [Sedimentisphaerales bacterium]